MDLESILSAHTRDLQGIAKQQRDAYFNAEPFPNIVFKNFFKDEYLDKILKDFPDLEQYDVAVRNNESWAGIGMKATPYDIRDTDSEGEVNVDNVDKLTLHESEAFELPAKRELYM